MEYRKHFTFIIIATVLLSQASSLASSAAKRSYLFNAIIRPLWGNNMASGDVAVLLIVPYCVVSCKLNVGYSLAGLDIFWATDFQQLQWTHMADPIQRFLSPIESRQARCGGKKWIFPACPPNQWGVNGTFPIFRSIRSICCHSCSQGNGALG